MSAVEHLSIVNYLCRLGRLPKPGKYSLILSQLYCCGHQPLRQGCNQPGIENTKVLVPSLPPGSTRQKRAARIAASASWGVSRVPGTLSEHATSMSAAAVWPAQEKFELPWVDSPVLKGFSACTSNCVRAEDSRVPRMCGTSPT